MKHRLFLIGLIMACGACTPQIAYQVLETHTQKPVANDQTLALDYDFWNADGVVYCTVKNLTDAPIYLDLNRSHLIVNGFVEEYHTDVEQTVSMVRSHTSYSYLSSAGSNSSQSASSRQTKEKAVRHLPPHSSLIIGGVSAVPHRFLACELDKWKAKTPATLSYTEESSPLKFRQFLTYSRRADLTETRTLDNAFWVERVSNMSPGSFAGANIKNEYCGHKLMTMHGTYPYAKAGNLYVSFNPYGH